MPEGGTAACTAPQLGNALDISFSIGIGLFPNDGEDFNTLLKNAHMAVESAKEAGRDTYGFFSHNMNAGLAEQIRLTGALTKAVRNHAFRLHYQPQISALLISPGTTEPPALSLERQAYRVAWEMPS